MLKNVDIPRLDSYMCEPDEDFWNYFPKKDLPKSAETTIDIKAFEKKIEEVRSKMTASEVRRASKIVKDLKNGTESYQKGPLLPIKTANAKSTYEHGELLTYTIASWIRKGFVAGPFKVPPTPGIRANPLAAVVWNGKIRPILNMSGPIGKSFNDNLNVDKLERLHMGLGTAKKFFWLGRYFVETRQPFGGNPAPSNFDRLGNTKDLVVCLLSGTP